MERNKANHAQRAMVAAGETTIFALAGLFYPPFYWGMATTALTMIIEEKLAIKESRQKISHQINQLGLKIDIHSQHTDSHEPIPPDPQTATHKEIQAYQEAVSQAASTFPHKNTNSSL